MAAYVGIQKQISRNNFLSILYLIAFPLLIFVPLWFGIYATNVLENAELSRVDAIDITHSIFWEMFPTVSLVIGAWFLIAYFGNTLMINLGTGARGLERSENPRVYNLTENLCMSIGMKMPKLQIIDSPVLNAFASGINEKNYRVTLTQGIIDELNDEELEGVIGHELTHIRNKDVRLLIISIVFVGIFAVLSEFLFRMLLYSGGGNRNNKNNKGNGIALLIGFILVLIGYFFSMLFKFGLSRKREYMADAGAAEMTKNPLALASALRKISENNILETANGEMKQLFIANNLKKGEKRSFSLSNIFATHPPIEKRIKALENF